MKKSITLTIDLDDFKEEGADKKPEFVEVKGYWWRSNDIRSDASVVFVPADPKQFEEGMMPKLFLKI